MLLVAGAIASMQRPVVLGVVAVVAGLAVVAKATVTLLS